MITGIVCQLQQIMAYVGNLRPKRPIEPNRDLGGLTLKAGFLYLQKSGGYAKNHQGRHFQKPGYQHFKC
jgi:hypothetical protein